MFSYPHHQLLDEIGSAPSVCLYLLHAFRLPAPAMATRTDGGFRRACPAGARPACRDALEGDPECGAAQKGAGSGSGRGAAAGCQAAAHREGLTDVPWNLAGG
eukprot:7387370-Prymnesium_polylepis.1